MTGLRRAAPAAAFLLVFTAAFSADGSKIADLLTGKSAFVDARNVKPGMFRKITESDLPKPYATFSASNTQAAQRPDGALPQAPAGLRSSIYSTAQSTASDSTAPNGDLFLAESGPARSRSFATTTANPKCRSLPLACAALRNQLLSPRQ